MNNNLDLSARNSSGQTLPQAPIAIPSISGRIGKAIPLHKLAPVQAAFSALTKDARFQSRAINAVPGNDGLASISWTVAQVGALFDAVYTSSEVTKGDEEKIAALGKQIDMLGSSLKARELTEAEKEYAQKCLEVAQNSLKELNMLKIQLHEFSSVRAELEKATVAIANKTNDPLYTGEMLFVVDDIRQGVNSLVKMKQQIESLPPESAARLSLEDFYAADSKAFVFYLEDWNAIASEYMQDEADLLWGEVGKIPDDLAALPKKTSLLRQLQALSDKQEELCKDLQALATQSKFTPELEGSLTEAAASIGRMQKTIDSKLQAKKTEPLLPLKYGSKAWKRLEKKRPQTTRSPFAQVIHTLTHPETWSDSTKTAVHTLLVGMQLTQTAIGVAKQLGQADEMKRQGELFQQQLQSMQNLPPEVKETVEHETAMLGTLLSDKYEALQKHPELIEKFSKKMSADGNFKTGLQEALTLFGEKPPSRHELRSFMNAFQLKEYAARSPSPFSHLSLEQWWTLFTQPQDSEIPEERSQDVAERTGLIPLQGYAYDVVTSSATRQIPWTQRLFNAIGNLFSSQSPEIKENQNTEFIAAQVEEGQHRLHTALGQLAQQKILLPPDVPLRPEMAQLEQDLMRLAETCPTASASLVQLAHWRQEVSDRSEAVVALKEPTVKTLVNPIEYAKKNVLQRFVESRSVAIDDRLLLHVLGDFFGQGTKLEGSNTAHVQTYRHALLSKKIAALRGERSNLCAVLGGVCDWLGIPQLGESFQTDEKMAAHFIAQIEKAMEIESVISPTGFQPWLVSGLSNRFDVAPLEKKLRSALTSLAPNGVKLACMYLVISYLK